jgi:hypothetical protein
MTLTPEIERVSELVRTHGHLFHRVKEFSLIGYTTSHDDFKIILPILPNLSTLCVSNRAGSDISAAMIQSCPFLETIRSNYDPEYVEQHPADQDSQDNNPTGGRLPRAALLGSDLHLHHFRDDQPGPALALSRAGGLSLPDRKSDTAVSTRAATIQHARPGKQIVARSRTAVDCRGGGCCPKV